MSASSMILSTVPADFNGPYWIESVELDFDTKVHASLEIDAAIAARKAGRFVWIDIDERDAAETRKLIEGLELVDEAVVEDIYTGEASNQLRRYAEYLHLVLATCRVNASGGLEIDRVDVLFGAGFLVTIHRGPSSLIDAVRRDYQSDFVEFAKTPSFLLYELWDHLTDHYVRVQKRLEKRVDELQVALLRATDEAVFGPIAEVGVSLLEFRSVLVPARSVLAELSTRRMVYVSEVTQGFLANMAGTIDVVVQDLLVDRDSLSQALNLSMSMVSQRTSRAMTKLTLLSTIFLPLTFLCGVYGMNFEHLPELKWRFGYLFFWAACTGIVAAALLLVRRSRLL